LVLAVRLAQFHIAFGRANWVLAESIIICLPRSTLRYRGTPGWNIPVVKRPEKHALTQSLADEKQPGIPACVDFATDPCTSK